MVIEVNGKKRVRAGKGRKDGRKEGGRGGRRKREKENVGIVLYIPEGN